MRTPALLRLVVLVMLGLLCARASRAQTGCPTTADTVVVSLSGTITYATSPVEQFATTVTQSRNQSLACGTPMQSLVGEPVCDPNLFPLPKLLAAQMFEALDKRIGLFDLACGNLSGSFTLGQAPFALVTGSFTLRRRSSTSVDATLTAFVPAGRSVLGMFDGGLTLKQNIVADGLGRARGDGSADVETTVGVSHVSQTTRYVFVGNPTGALPAPRRVTHDMDYDCTRGVLTSDLCYVSAAVPATPLWALALFPVAVLLFSRFVGQRRARVG